MTIQSIVEYGALTIAVLYFVILCIALYRKRSK
jgi:hypothetical protein